MMLIFTIKGLTEIIEKINRINVNACDIIVNLSYFVSDYLFCPNQRLFCHGDLTFIINKENFIFILLKLDQIFSMRITFQILIKLCLEIEM